MNISPVSYNKALYMRANDKKSAANNKEYMMVGKAKVPYNPATIGVANAALWMGIGLAFDRALSFLSGSKHNMKTSLVLNSVIGLGMGAFSYYSASKDFKAKSQSVEK